MDEEDEEGDLPEIDEDEIAFEEGLIADFEAFANDKDTTEVNKLHPKLIPLLLSIVFMLISFITVSYFRNIFKFCPHCNSRQLTVPMR